MNTIKINGTDFNKDAVASYSKSEFITMGMQQDHYFTDAKDKEKQLGAAYDLITGTTDSEPEQEKSERAQEE